MPNYRLISDGDSVEKEYYFLFIGREFPSYEIFWQQFITPLSRRPASIQLKNDAELANDGRIQNDICIAQLHYSTLLHLIRAYGFLNLPPIKLVGCYLD